MTGRWYMVRATPSAVRLAVEAWGPDSECHAIERALWRRTVAPAVTPAPGWIRVVQAETPEEAVGMAMAGEGHSPPEGWGEGYGSCSATRDDGISIQLVTHGGRCVKWYAVGKGLGRGVDLRVSTLREAMRNVDETWPRGAPVSLPAAPAIDEDAERAADAFFARRRHAGQGL